MNHKWSSHSNIDKNGGKFMLKKRRLTAVMAALLSVSLAACGGQPKAEEQPKAPASGGKNPVVANEKFTITAIDFRYGDPPPTSSPGIDMINEKFNVDYKPVFVPNTAFDEKINAVFASGQIPDMIGLMSTDLKNRYNKFAKQGAFLDLEPYINDYPTLKAVPDYIWDSMRVNGKIHAIPQYAPKYQVVTVLRKDWLDKLGLKPPTNYEELKEVALAFTNGDPDGNNKKDTYGIAIGQDINPNFNQGPYWDPDAWYHQDAQGNYIPGIIGEGRREFITMLSELYKQGAMTKDYAVLNWGDTNKEFYSGKAGIFIGTPRGMSQDYMNGLLAIHPEAEFVHLDPFMDKYGNQGLMAGAGYNGLTVLSAKLQDEPEKLKKVLEMIDFGRKFYPQDQKNEKNADFDWFSGKVGSGYVMKDGLPVFNENFGRDGLGPSTYYVDNSSWVPQDSDNVYSITYQTKQLVDLVAAIETMYKDIKLYINPINGLESLTDNSKGAELRKYVMDEQVKMIAGTRPVSDWDKLVQEYLDKGGAQVIQEYNANIKEKDPKALFK